jgi:hypothetical protein
MFTFWLNNNTNAKYNFYEVLCIVVVYEVLLALLWGVINFIILILFYGNSFILVTND